MIIQLELNKQVEALSILSKTIPNLTYSEPDEMMYSFRVMHVKHFREMQNFMNQLFTSNLLSDHQTYRGYLSELSFSIPDSIQDAKSVIIMAISTPIAHVNFHYQGEVIETVIPPQYYRLGITQDQLKDLIHEEMIQQDGFQIEYANSHLFLKNLAATTGLAKYGRNNICYVDDMGSMISLHAFLTDFEFDEDDHGEVQMMDCCKSCRICMNSCPTGAIQEDRVVIDAGRCVPLYNEIEGTFPEWIPQNAHNSLMGCMRCQFTCPANKNALMNSIRFEDVTDEETEMILQGTPNSVLLESLTEKLRGFYPATSESYFPVFTRNLRALIL